MLNKYYLQRKYKVFKHTLHTQGVPYTIQKSLKSVIYSPIAQRIKYAQTRDKYPQNIIFIAGWAKSGSTWMWNMLASLEGFQKYYPLKWYFDYNELYPHIFDEVSQKLVVIRGHTWATDDNLQTLHYQGLRYIITVRDPRDKMISHYWHVRNHSDHKEHELGQKFTLSEYIDYKLSSGEYQHSLNWVRQWLDNCDPELSLVSRYEDMLADPVVQMTEILSFLQIQISAEEISTLVTNNSFEKVAGRKRGVEDKTSFQRKGISGEWDTVFTAEQREAFLDIGADLLERLNYKK